MGSIEIYLRHSGDRALLMFHVPARLRDTFRNSMQIGSLSDRHVPINFEAPVLPEWMPAQDEPQYIRATIDEIRVQYDEY